MEITQITNKIKELHAPARTLIVGIDGLGGAGKSTVSQELYKALYKENYNVTLLHIDDFIHQRSVRYNESYAEWECYYFLQWRYDYLINEVISPIRRGGDFFTQIELYDKDNDCYFLSDVHAPVGSIIIVEGVFLQRKELCGVFDYMIYIDIPENVRLSRVLRRDGYIGSDEQIKYKYDNRYFPAEHYYQSEYSPVQNADYIIRE